MRAPLPDATPRDWHLCPAIIDLRAPIRSERVRDFQPPWRTVFVYRCRECGTERRVRANSFRGITRSYNGSIRGTTPEPSMGAIVCGAYLPGAGL